MLQPLFHIESDNIATQDFQSCRLLIVVDDHSLSYVILNTTSHQPFCIKYFHFNQIRNREQNEILREIIYGDELLSKEVNEIFLVMDSLKVRLFRKFVLMKILIKNL